MCPRQTCSGARPSDSSTAAISVRRLDEVRLVHDHRQRPSAATPAPQPAARAPRTASSAPDRHVVAEPLAVDADLADHAGAHVGAVDARRSTLARIAASISSHVARGERRRQGVLAVRPAAHHHVHARVVGRSRVARSGRGRMPSHVSVDDRAAAARRGTALASSTASSTSSRTTLCGTWHEYRATTSRVARRHAQARRPRAPRRSPAPTRNGVPSQSRCSCGSTTPRAATGTGPEDRHHRAVPVRCGLSTTDGWVTVVPRIASTSARLRPGRTAPAIDQQFTRLHQPSLVERVAARPARGDRRRAGCGPATSSPTPASPPTWA